MEPALSAVSRSTAVSQSSSVSQQPERFSVPAQVHRDPALSSEMEPVESPPQSNAGFSDTSEDHQDSFPSINIDQATLRMCASSPPAALPTSLAAEASTDRDAMLASSYTRRALSVASRSSAVSQWSTASQQPERFSVPAQVHRDPSLSSEMEPAVSASPESDSSRANAPSLVGSPSLASAHSIPKISSSGSGSDESSTAQADVSSSPSN